MARTRRMVPAEATLASLPMTDPIRPPRRRTWFDKAYSGTPSAQSRRRMAMKSMCRQSQCEKSANASPAGGRPPLDCGGRARLDEPFSAAPGPLEKKACNYMSLIYFACAIICWRKCEV